MPIRIIYAPIKKNKARRPPKRYRISSIGRCLAEQLFGMVEAEQREVVFSPRTQLIFALGDAIEWKLIQKLRDSGAKIISKGPDGKQFRVEGDNPERVGHLDGLILFEDKWWPFDVKSAGSWGFEKWVGAAGYDKFDIKKDNFKLYDPREMPNQEHCPVKTYSPDYYYQAQGYMERLIANRKEIEEMSLLEGYPLGEGFYFFVMHKDDSALYQEFVTYQPDAINARLLTLERGYGIIKTKAGKFKRPTKKLVEKIRKERAYKLNNGQLYWKCKSCAFLRVCWGEEKPKLVERELKKDERIQQRTTRDSK